MKGRSVVGSLTGVMKGSNVSMDMKRSLSNSTLLPTLTYGSEYWTWSRAQQSRVRAVEMSYLRGGCGVNRWDGVSNVSVYERCSNRPYAISGVCALATGMRGRCDGGGTQ